MTAPQLPTLTDDCENCAALCCVAYPFDDADAFAADKKTDEPCANLDCGFKCQIHPQLTDRGFSGCVAYSCAGAGQRVTQQLFDGETWRDDPDLLPHMTYALRVVRPIHEALLLLIEAQRLPVPQSLIDHGKSLIADLCPANATHISDFEAPKVQDALAEVPLYFRTLAPFVR